MRDDDPVAKNTGRSNPKPAPAHPETPIETSLEVPYNENL
jgi:hypothetical protein